MKYIDIHTHKTISDCDTIMVRNLSLSEAEKIILSDADGFFSVGIHPWDVLNVDENLEIRLMKVCEDRRILFVGECGLDKNSNANLERQLEIFRSQISISELLEKPLIIHCVGYFNELIEIKKSANPKQKWIIHGFRGKPQLAGQLLKAGINLSFGEKLNPESVNITPVQHLYIETDESSITIEEVYRNIAEIKNCGVEELNANSLLLEGNIASN